MRLRSHRAGTAGLLAWLLLAGIGPASGQELKRSGFVGVQVTAPAPDAAGTPVAGVRVQALAAGGTAAAAGIQPDDIITELDGRPVAGVDAFVQSAKNLKAGDTVTVKLTRGAEALSFNLVVKPRPFETSPDADTHYKAVTVDGSLRRVIVTAPKQRGRHPALLYLTGIGCFSQESLDLKSVDARLLYGLTEAGFVTMRVEKSGTGDSQGPPCSDPRADFQAEVRSYRAGLKALQGYAFVDPAKIFLMGISIGGVEAPLVARGEKVRGLVVINTVAKPFFEYLIETRRRQLQLRRLAHDEIDQRMLLDERCNHRLLIEQQAPEQVLAADAQCADHIQYPAPATFMQQWAALNPAEAWKAIDAPVLVAYGSSDYISSIADDPYLVELINTFHPGRATLSAIPDMDHYLIKAASMSESMERKTPGEFEPAILEAVKGWLRRQLGAAGAA
jgi:pimeloyl-ACP methyl ester carboxylesterase